MEAHESAKPAFPFLAALLLVTRLAFERVVDHRVVRPGYGSTSSAPTSGLCQLEQDLQVVIH